MFEVRDTNKKSHLASLDPDMEPNFQRPLPLPHLQSTKAAILTVCTLFPLRSICVLCVSCREREEGGQKRASDPLELE